MDVRLFSSHVASDIFAFDAAFDECVFLCSVLLKLQLLSSALDTGKRK